MSELLSDPKNPLRNYWHAVALSSDVTNKPIATTLMDEDLVLWRTETGVSALEDRCVHRGTRLSLGWVEKNRLLCPYHGWEYDSGGIVKVIPSNPPERPIPAKAHVGAYHCAERYGLIFVCLGEPKQPLYEVPEFEREDFKCHIVGPVIWQADAGRSLENFMDEAHLPWAHPDMLGNRDNIPVVSTRTVEEQDGGFYFECQSEVGNRLNPDKLTINRLTYHIALPYTLYHENIYPNGDRVIDLFFSTPISEARCARYMVVARNFGLEHPPDKFIAFTKKIWEQDRILIESQRPVKLPTDWNKELHLRGPDGPSVTYRKMLAALSQTDKT